MINTVFSKLSCAPLTSNLVGWFRQDFPEDRKPMNNSDQMDKIKKVNNFAEVFAFHLFSSKPKK